MPRNICGHVTGGGYWTCVNAPHRMDPDGHWYVHRNGMTQDDVDPQEWEDAQAEEAAEEAAQDPPLTVAELVGPLPRRLRTP